MIRGDEHLKHSSLSGAECCTYADHGYIKTVVVLDHGELYLACPRCLRIGNEISEVRIKPNSSSIVSNKDEESEPGWLKLTRKAILNLM